MTMGKKLFFLEKVKIGVRPSDLILTHKSTVLKHLSQSSETYKSNKNNQVDVFTTFRECLSLP